MKYNGTVYRRRFIKAYGYGPYKCAGCDVDVPKIGRHRGEGHVHHINHDHDDNRLENLELLCTDCHTHEHKNWIISHTPENKIRRSEGMKGHPVSDETRKKMSEARTRYWERKRARE